MWIQCFITKSDGSDVFVDFEGVRYIFSRNPVGDSVCFVGNQGHARRLLSMGSANYVKYEPPKGLDQNTQPGATPVPLGGRQERRQPEAREPLPDALSVDEALTEGGQVESAPVESATKGITAEDRALGQKQLRPLNNPTAAEGVAAAEAEAKEKSDAETASDWHPGAIENKINEFKYLEKNKFKAFIDENSDLIMDWPVEVRKVIAKKLSKKFPGEDHSIEGFVINDYLVNDTGDS